MYDIERMCIERTHANKFRMSINNHPVKFLDHSSQNDLRWNI
jgi:hypothetical protein